MKKKIVIINSTQYGYLSDLYFFVENSYNEFDIIFICFDQGYKKKDINSKASIHYFLPTTKNSILKLNQFNKFSLNLINKYKPDFIFVEYYFFCSIIKIISNKIPFLLDIRTSFIYKNKLKRIIYNKILKIESLFYENISIISEGVGFLLKIKKFKVFPLGSPKFDLVEKKFNQLNLLYVGTFYNREIEKTILGVKIFVNKYPNIKINYKIIGYGSKNEIDLLLYTIKNNDLSEHVEFIGEVRYPELKEYFVNSNIGVSYIPINEYFNYQPPTKTYEYLLSGNAVIATKTAENAKIINLTNGILISDNEYDFAYGLEYLENNLINFNSKEIQKKAYKYSWENIIKNIYIPHINNLIKSQNDK